ncbi:unnamed protein product [Rotaria magnacalcarata]|uniref:ZZ-type domain-containing protein n=3 Tax=Rotaria magnacalcarata TaxID=392030 RepID=A0A815LU11_9BILA|nr:unnamed protein product [Rotaria magnacalcarata]CAF4151419.1 unnamed protein product [Rotaria magnacalcarata]CAF4221210.1 unnamed protein product [Rotaria magnacalcarata]
MHSNCSALGIYSYPSNLVSYLGIHLDTQVVDIMTSLSIFNSGAYLYGLLSYCSHCNCLVVMDKEPSFQCQQCPNSSFGICVRCMPLMTTKHPSVYAFSKQPLSYWAKMAHDLYHLDITCDGCSKQAFNGKRYQCEECSPSYDLCENCFGKKDTEHKLKYIKNPLLHSANQENLGKRVLISADRNGGNNTNWRDPLTGWTKSDAEEVIKQAIKEKENYNNRLQQILKNSEERSKELLQHSQLMLYESYRRLQDTMADSSRRMLWSFQRFFRR